MSLYPTPHDDLTCPNAREVAALRKRVEELWFDLCEYQKHEQQLCPEEEGFVTYIPKLKARAEEAETGLARALPIWEEALKLARERAEKAERELDEANVACTELNEARGNAVDRLIATQADLDAALDCLEFHLGKLPLDCCPGCNGSGTISREAPGDAECPYSCRGEWPSTDTKRVSALLEKRRSRAGQEG